MILPEPVLASNLGRRVELARSPLHAGYDFVNHSSRTRSHLLHRNLALPSLSPTYNEQVARGVDAAAATLGVS